MNKLEGDRCLILSENRPYWLMTDIAIMNAGGISVPIFTTYSENDYEYILNDCKPSLIFVSNQDPFYSLKLLIIQLHLHSSIKYPHDLRLLL